MFVGYITDRTTVCVRLITQRTESKGATVMVGFLALYVSIYVITGACDRWDECELNTLPRRVDIGREHATPYRHCGS